MRNGNKSNGQKPSNPRPSRELTGDPTPLKAAPERPSPRFDRPGHLAEDHAQRLLRMSKRRAPDDSAFLMANKGSTDDELAEELAEQAVSAMTGGDTWMEFVDKTVDEDEGGPFVETPASREYARGSDQDVDGFLREALPTTRNGVKGRAQKRH